MSDATATAGIAPKPGNRGSGAGPDASGRSTPGRAGTWPKAGDPLLSVRGLTVEFATEQGWRPVVTDVSFDIAAGQTVGLVGESGSGKSVTCQSILRLIKTPPGRISAGEVLLQDRDILKLDQRHLEDLRGSEVAMIFQEPMTSLNPVFTIGDQIGEVVRRHRGFSRGQAKRRAIEVLDMVGIPQAGVRVDDYPHQFSGGMRQRAMIAMALAAEPKLLIADEPTTALDVTIQAQVLDLLKELGSHLQMGVLFITHDLGVVAEVCHDVYVMYAGQIVEHAASDPLFTAPRHPYTEGLMKSLPNVESDDPLHVIPGRPPLPWEFAEGCRFAPRCDYAVEACRAEPVSLHQEGHRSVRCIRAEELSLEGCS